MNLQDQVCSLELAKELKEIGVKQESLFWWTAYENPLAGILKEEDVPEDRWNIMYSRQTKKSGFDWLYSAFTVTELGMMLPYKINDQYCLTILKNVNESWAVSYYNNIHNRLKILTIDETEANAMAMMVIKLIRGDY